MMRIDWARLVRAITGEPEPSRYKDFPTLADLEAWFDLHKEFRMPVPNLCDDYARESRALAETDGYYLSYCLVYEGKTYGQAIFTKPDGSPDTSVFHIGNMAIVTDIEEVWYVDLTWGKLVRLAPFLKGGKY